MLFWDWLCFWRPPCRLRRVQINLTYSPTEALRGVLWSYRGGWLTLRDAEGLAIGKTAAAIDGDVVIHIRNVAFFQVLESVVDLQRVAA